jgi:DNA polymerase-3 subunit epsilon
MFDEPIVFVDIETNGGVVGKGKITEIAAIRVENGDVVDSFTSLVNPGSPLPAWITSLTGITDADLVQAPYFDEIAEPLKRMFDGAIFAAHNVRFDYSFIKQHFQQIGFDYRPKLFCTVRMSRALYPEFKGHSLQKIIERHNIPVDDRHRAYADAKAIFDFAELAYAEKGKERFDQAKQKQFKSRSLPPNLDAKYLDGVEDKPGVYIFETESGAILYVGKSVHLRTRIKSHFTQDTAVNKEMNLSMQSHKLQVTETTNELEALLLESSLVKKLDPILNRQLRRVTSHYVLLASTNEEGYRTVTVADRDVTKGSNLSEIYGMFTSKAKAKEALESSRKAYILCPKLLGLEKITGACFQSQLGRCKGACIGKEPVEGYNERVELALKRTKIELWPFKTPIAIGSDSTDMVVVNNWIIEGHLKSFEDSDPIFEPVEKIFDLDTYRILHKFISKSKNTFLVRPIASSLLTQPD